MAQGGSGFSPLYGDTLCRMDTFLPSRYMHIILGGIIGHRLIQI